MSPQTKISISKSIYSDNSEERRKQLKWVLLAVVVLVVVCAAVYMLQKRNADVAAAQYKQQLTSFRKDFEVASAKALGDVGEAQLSEQLDSAKANGATQEELKSLINKIGSQIYTADYTVSKDYFDKLPTLDNVTLGTIVSSQFRDAQQRQQDIADYFAKYLQHERYTLYGLEFDNLAVTLKTEFVDRLEIAKLTSQLGDELKNIGDIVAADGQNKTLATAYDLDLTAQGQFKKSIEDFPLPKEFESIRVKALESNANIVASQKKLVEAYTKGDTDAYKKQLKIYNDDTKFEYATTFVEDVGAMATKIAKTTNAEKPIDMAPKLRSLLTYN